MIVELKAVTVRRWAREFWKIRKTCAGKSSGRSRTSTTEFKKNIFLFLMFHDRSKYQARIQYGFELCF